MKYRNPQLRRSLAAEYALGTLVGRARRRFEHLAASDSELQRETAAWERRLALLEPSLPPIWPRPQVWTGIARSIGAVPNLGVIDTPIAAANDQRFWRAWASLASAAAAVLAILLFARMPLNLHLPGVRIPAQSYVALMQMPNSTMHWTLSIVPAHGRVRVAADGEPPPLDGKSLELWWISPDGPIAIGVLPTSGTGSLLVPQGLGEKDEAVKLAISVEPVGGSPTGKPTGPVVIVTDAVKTA